jgi:hypothetical protein
MMPIPHLHARQRSSSTSELPATLLSYLSFLENTHNFPDNPNEKQKKIKENKEKKALHLHLKLRNVHSAQWPLIV